MNRKQRQDRNKRFRMALAKLEMTQDDFAEMIGVDPSTLSKVLSGRRNTEWVQAEIAVFVDENLHQLS